jgi:hypothetical protein
LFRDITFLQLLEDVIVAATFEAFAVVGEDVDRAIVVVATPIAKCFLARRAVPAWAIQAAQRGSKRYRCRELLHQGPPN